ncbi:cyclophane-forming radical SAM/SPASM peptide maturase GrrM/OscB [Alcanivorax nanhaiticus]|nr:cyclophane-forming radical SAM/SPASM peptide maturase GrrM/OscB [Alcanivorax nanhaiticus]
MRLIVVQPTSLCNLDCSYCYVPNRQDKTMMSFDVLEEMIKNIFSSSFLDGHNVEFLWHAGEPLLAGIKFYEKAISLIEKYNVKNIEVHQSVQTNAIPITDQWCDFFAKHNFNVGISVDGPKFLHDKNRRNWSNKGSFDQVMRGFCKLRSHDIGTGALCVLTREHLDYPEELFKFFIENGFESVGFNIEEIDNANLTSSLNLDKNIISSETLIRFRTFFSKLYDIWLPYSGKFDIREFQDFFNVSNLKISDSSYVREPDETKNLGIVTIHKNGDISPFSPEFAGAESEKYNNFIIGNVFEDKFDDLMFKNEYQVIYRDIEKKKESCQKECQYFSICGGDYASNSYFESGDISQTHSTACKLLRQELSDILLEKLIKTKYESDGKYSMAI